VPVRPVTGSCGRGGMRKAATRLPTRTRTNEGPRRRSSKQAVDEDGGRDLNVYDYAEIVRVQKKAEGTQEREGKDRRSAIWLAGCTIMPSGNKR
jgi:hypothetical protein